MKDNVDKTSAEIALDILLKKIEHDYVNGAIGDNDLLDRIEKARKKANEYFEKLQKNL